MRNYGGEAINGAESDRIGSKQVDIPTVEKRLPESRRSKCFHRPHSLLDLYARLKEDPIRHLGEKCSNGALRLKCNNLLDNLFCELLVINVVREGYYRHSPR
jgi:hypothetical protein